MRIRLRIGTSQPANLKYARWLMTKLEFANKIKHGAFFTNLSQRRINPTQAWAGPALSKHDWSVVSSECRRNW
jgi:hypothetical protein